MRMKDAMERAKELANLVYDGGCEVAVETYEDGYADMREGSAYVAMVKQRTGDMPRVLSELGNDPWQVLDGLVKRLEEAAVSKLHSKRQEAGRTQKKLSEQIKAIEEGRPLPVSRRSDLRYPRKGRRFRPRWPTRWDPGCKRAITVDMLGLALAVEPEPKQVERRTEAPFRASVGKLSRRNRWPRRH